MGNYIIKHDTFIWNRVKNNSLYFFNSHIAVWPREPSAKTFHSSFSVEFSKHCVLSGGTQRRALPAYQGKEIKILIDNYSFLPMRGSNLQPSRLHACATAPQRPQIAYFYNNSSITIYVHNIIND